MILSVNVGNSVISFGVFDSEIQLKTSFDISCDIRKTSDEYVSLIKSIMRDKNVDPQSISDAILASVVPQLTDNIKAVLAELVGKAPLVVGPGVKTGFHIKIDDPSELGADMVANTVAALHTKKPDHAVIVVDFGDVTTISAIGKAGEYLGCAISPGVRLSFDAMYEGAARLPSVELGHQTKAIGKNSESSIRAGVLLGNAFAVDGFVAKMAGEMRLDVSCVDLLATGRYAPCIIDACKNKFEYDAYLSLKGLCYILKNNL